MVISNISFGAYHCYTYFKQADPTYKYYYEFLKIYAVIFIIQGVFFGLGGIMINLRLKRNFGDFYDSNRKILLIASYGLSISMISRGVFGIIVNWNPEIRQVLNKHTGEYQAGIFIFGTLLPTIF